MASNNEPIVFPDIKWFPPLRSYQPLPVIDNRIVEGCECFPTQAQAAYACTWFYRNCGMPMDHVTGENDGKPVTLQERIDHIQGGVVSYPGAPKDAPTNAVMKLAMLKPEQKTNIEATMAPWLKKGYIMELLKVAKQRSNTVKVPTDGGGSSVEPPVKKEEKKAVLAGAK